MAPCPQGNRLPFNDQVSDGQEDKSKKQPAAIDDLGADRDGRCS